MARRVLAIATVAALLGCQRTEPSKAQPVAAAAPVAAAPTHGEPIDVHGIVVTFQDNGMVAIHGRDQFGGTIDTLYENVDFLRNALPVLDRSLTTEQAVGLRALVRAK